MLCEYGCYNEAKYQLQNGKWCCSSSHNRCLGLLNTLLKNRNKAEKIYVEDRKNVYYNNPKLCLFCNSIIEYENSFVNKFCNKSCSAKYNNKKRKHSFETKLKISNSVKEKLGIEKTLKPYIEKNTKYGRHCKIIFANCKVCEKLFVTEKNSPRKTCSRKCHIIASTSNRNYQNGSRKNIYYFHDNKNVLLESSWELKVAELLDKLNIKWTRPKPISWTDNINKSRLYYPDFYLIDKNVYLDPKNEYCMIQDKEKMEKVSKLINIKFGKLDYILDFINNLEEYV